MYLNPIYVCSSLEESDKNYHADAGSERGFGWDIHRFLFIHLCVICVDIYMYIFVSFHRYICSALERGDENHYRDAGAERGFGWDIHRFLFIHLCVICVDIYIYIFVSFHIYICSALERGDENHYADTGAARAFGSNICIYVSLFLYIHTHLYIQLHICMYIWTCIYVYTYTYTHTHTYIRVYPQRYMFLCLSRKGVLSLWASRPERSPPLSTLSPLDAP